MEEIDHKFLEAVIRLTGQRDRESLEASLVGVMRDLIPASEVALYKIYDLEVLLAISSAQNDVDSEVQEQAVLLNEHAEFLNCMSRRDMLVIALDDRVKIIVPVLIGESVVGFLTVICDALPACNQPLIAGLMQIFQNQLSILSENECDRLTGLLNRKTFDDKIGKILVINQDANQKKFFEEHRKFSTHGAGQNWLAMIDIDHFKWVNDTFGHLYGDEVLLLLSRLMKKTFRSADLLFRYGGEEFIVVLPSLAIHDVWIALERFRSAVEDYPFPQVGKVTVSIGFVDMRSQYVPATVVGHADQALYYAKRNGRNRICSYDELILSGELDGGMASHDAEFF